MRKIFSLIVSIMLVFTFVPQTILANDIVSSGEAVARWSYVSSIGVEFYPSGDFSGDASLSTSNKFTLTLTLQNKISGRWEDVDSWSETTQIYSFISDSYELEDGVTYRIKVTVDVYDSADRVIETASKYSSTVTG